MSLLDDVANKCVLMEKKRMPDGAGGYIVAWAEGAEFRARVMNGVMVACGSLYMAADVRRYFGRTE